MIELFAITYGYWALFIGTLLEGEIVLIIAGFLAELGYLELRTVIAVAFLGSLVSDQFFFWLGQNYGNQIVAKWPKLQRRFKKVTKLLQKHQVTVMILFRFIYGFRIMSPIALGMSKINRAKFVFFNVLGATIWSLAFGIGGYVFGNTMRILLSDIQHYGIELVGGLAILGIIIWALVIIKRKLTDSETED